MGVLSGEEIKRRANDIFASGYDKTCVDVAAYNLRVNDKEIVIDGNVYNDDNPYNYQLNEGFIKLPAKKVSIISTIEKLKMPKDLCAIVGITFSFSRKGLISLFGPQVDPGYHGPFYAVVYNTSDKDVYLKKGDQLFKMIVMRVEGSIKTKSHYSGSIFRNLSEELKELTKDETIGKSILENRIDSLSKKIGGVDEKVEEVASGYRNIVWFGIFLVSASIFGVVLSFLLANYTTITSLKGGDWFSIVISVIMALFIGGWIMTVIAVIKNMMERKRREEEERE